MLVGLNFQFLVCLTLCVLQVTMTTNTILITQILHDVNNEVPKYFLDLGFSLMFYKGFVLITVTLFTELEVLNQVLFLQQKNIVYNQLLKRRHRHQLCGKKSSQHINEKANRVSITVWKTRKCSRGILCHRVRHHEQYGELFYKTIFTFYISFLFRLFYKGNRKQFFRCSQTLYKHSWKFVRTRNCVGKLALYGLVFPLQFLVIPNFNSCFNNCMDTRKKFSISLM